MDRECQNALDKNVKLSQNRKVNKLLERPVKMVYSKLLEKVAHILNKKFKVRAELFFGDEMLVIFPETVSLHLFRYMYFEEGLTRIIIELLKPGNTFFDIGSHFGYYTLLGSQIVGDNGQVHSFEPTPSTFDILNINANGKQNVVLNNLGVSSTTREVELMDYGLEYSAFNSITRESRLDEGMRTRIEPKIVKAKATSLDDYVKNRGVRPNFIKIDAESAELEILQGAKYVFRNIRPIISLEVGDLGVPGAPSSHDVVRYLLEQGYEVYQYGSMVQPLIKHKVKERYNYDNLLFMPK